MKMRENTKYVAFLIAFKLMQFPRFVFLHYLFRSQLDKGGHAMKMGKNGEKNKKSRVFNLHLNECNFHVSYFYMKAFGTC